MIVTVYPQYSTGLRIEKPPKHVGGLDMASDMKCVLIQDGRTVLELFDVRLINMGAIGFTLAGKERDISRTNTYYHQEWWVIPCLNERNGEDDRIHRL